MSEAELREWGRPSGVGALLTAATLWSRFAPRGKGWVPRKLGRRFGAAMRATVRTRGGGLVAVDPSNLDIYAWVACHAGAWEPQIQNACAALARPGDVVYDVGANAGIVTIDLAARLNGNVTLIAFEPIPTLARCLALSAALNGFDGRIRVYDVMIGARDGTAALFIPDHAVHASGRERARGNVRIDRTMCTIDTLVKGRAIPPPALIKVDVEGAELEVFRGAESTLRRFRPAVIFEADNNLRRAANTRADLVNALVRCADYRFYYVTPRGVEPAEDLARPFDEDHNNMLALPPERPVPEFGADVPRPRPRGTRTSGGLPAGAPERPQHVLS